MLSKYRRYFVALLLLAGKQGLLLAGEHAFGKGVKEKKDRSTLTGDWNGARTQLKNAGVDVVSSYVNDALGNPVGGQHRGFAYADSFGISLDIDLEKIAHLKGLSFFTSFVYRSGSNLSAKRIGNEFPVAQVYGTETYQLNELYFQQSLFKGKLTLKAGRLDGGNDFLTSPLYWEYVNNAFDGNPISIFFNTDFTAYPHATWGAYVGIRPCKELLLKFAVYNMNVNLQKNRYHGVNFTFASTQGVMWITEWAYLLNQKGSSHGYPGNYKVGYYYVTGEVPRFLGGEQKGNYGYYFLADQLIYRIGDKERGLTPFVACVFAPKNRNQFPFFVMSGLVFHGPFTSRPDDEASFGVAYGHYSENLRHAQREAKAMRMLGTFGNRPQTFETVLEVNYWFQITKWLAITPDIQYIINPKGFGTIRDALVVGMQLAVQI